MSSWYIISSGFMTTGRNSRVLMKGEINIMGCANTVTAKPDMPKTIEYVAKGGMKGILYNWHYDDWNGEWHYSMRILDKDGFETLHAYNATPTTMAELKNVVDKEPWTYFLHRMAEKKECE